MATIVIDAGHGGADPGAVFEGRQEKDDIHCGWHWQWERFWRKTDRM